MAKKVYLVPVGVMCLMIGGQVCASLVGAAYKLKHGKPVYYQTWPFVDYPMYSKSSGPPVQTSTLALFALTDDDGVRVAVDTEAMGINYFAWRFNVVERLVAPALPTDADPALAALVEEHREEALEKVMQAAETVSGQRPTRLIVERTIYELQGRSIQRDLVTTSLDIHGHQLVPHEPESEALPPATVESSLIDPSAQAKPKESPAAEAGDVE